VVDRAAVRWRSHLQTRLRRSHDARDLPLSWKACRRMRFASGAGRLLQSVSFGWRDPMSCLKGGGQDMKIASRNHLQDALQGMRVLTTRFGWEQGTAGGQTCLAACNEGL